MQCLFCGKELALLKRLRGGGEFCSEAHRKEYQEQYEQLALARLLHAKVPAEPAAPLGRPAPKAPVAVHSDLEKPHVEDVPAPARLEPQVQSRPQSVRQPVKEKPAALEPAQESDPAPLAGFLSEPVVPAVVTFQQAGLLELEHITSSNLPEGIPMGSAASAASDAGGQLRSAPRVEIGLSLQALDHHTRQSERGAELREFVGVAPVIELHLRPQTGTEPARAAEVMEIPMSPHPPQKAASWLGGPRVFSGTPAELGPLSRLDFTTTGFAYSDGAALAPPEQITNSPQTEPLVQPTTETHEIPETPQAVVTSTPAPHEPAAPSQVTKVLPVTLHGLAAPGGKLTPMVTSALSAAADVQIPVSSSLPLRPAIVFGPAPAPVRAPEPAPAPVQAKPVPAKPIQPKPVQEKLVQEKPVQEKPVQAKPVQEKPAQEKPAQEKPIEKTLEPARPTVVPAPKPVPVQVKRPVAPEIAAPTFSTLGAKAPKPRVEQRTESPAPKFAEAAPQADLGLPSLSMEGTETAWSKLSAGVKIGVAAAVILGIAGIGYLVTRGGGKTSGQATTTTAPVATAPVASGVPISGGWSEDWANASKTKRHISLLSGSAKLSDYRMEFQAQIETKAIGWVFRGLNPRNYYVAKLETTKPGLQPTVALVHFAVVDGQDENRVVIPLPMKVRLDTTYKIRFEAVGNHFSAWVQDQKIDEWTDSRFGSGGVGLFSERDEQAALQGNVNVVALVPKN